MERLAAGVANVVRNDVRKGVNKSVIDVLMNLKTEGTANRIVKK